MSFAYRASFHARSHTLACTLAAFALTVAPTAAARAQCDDPQPLTLQPARYEMDLEVDYEAETIQGDVRLTVANRGDRPVAVIPLLVYRLMTVDSVRDEGGRALEYAQRVLSFEDWAKLQVNAVEVALPEPLAPGGERTIRLSYGGHLLGYSETGMLYVRDHVAPEFTMIRRDAYAYPKVGIPCLGALRATGLTYYDYRVSVTVPDSLVVANGGELVERATADGRATYTYRSTRPAWRMDFGIAPYGTLTSGDTRVFYLPGDSAGAARVLGAVEAGMELFADWFGPLGAARGLTIIEIPDGWGSQKDETTIIQTAAAFRDPARMSELYHEVSHFWNAPDLDLPSPRWNEGLASYLEEVAVEELEGRKAVEERVETVARWLRDRLDERPRLREVPLSGYGREAMTDFSYSVGMVFFAALDRLAGREAFKRIVGGYFRKYKEDGGSLDAFAEYAGRMGPDALDALFRDWVYTTAWADVLRDRVTLDGIVAKYRGG